MQGAEPAASAAHGHAHDGASHECSGRTQAVRCALELGDGGLAGDADRAQGSHVLTSLLGADGLAIIEPGSRARQAGTELGWSYW